MTCSRCKTRPALPYHRYCRECRRAYYLRPDQRTKQTAYARRQRHTSAGWAQVRWSNMTRRALNRDGRHPAYRDVELRIDKAAFLVWAIPALTTWLAEHPGEQPSIDRIDPAGHYEAGNLQILSMTDNSRKRRHLPYLNAPPGLAWCSKCRTYKPIDEFWKDRATPHGLQFLCKPCQYAANRAALLKRRWNI